MYGVYVCGCVGVCVCGIMGVCQRGCVCDQKVSRLISNNFSFYSF